MSANKFKPKTILLIPDIHAKPNDDLARLEKMRRWLKLNKQPIHKVIQIGDLWDFDSLCTHDMHTPEWHTRTLRGDIDAGFRALDIILAAAKDHQLLPSDVLITGGNHEDRYDKYLKSDNRLLTSDFPPTVRALLATNPKTQGVKYQGFLKPYTTYGITFSHYFVSGVMGRPVGGERPAANLLRSQFISSVCGHSHLYDFAERTRGDASKIYALVAGCFVNPEAPFAYAGAARKLWWNGFHLLHCYKPGEFDVQSVSIERL